MPSNNLTAFLEIGSVPHEERSLSVGIDPPWAVRAQAERFLRQVRRTFAVPTDVPAAFHLRGSHHHDFGSYWEVAVCYDPSDARATAFAYSCEHNAPSHWDSGARADALVQETLRDAAHAHSSGLIDQDTLFGLRREANACSDDVAHAAWLSARLHALTRSAAQTGYTPEPALALERWSDAQRLLAQAGIEAEADAIFA